MSSTDAEVGRKVSQWLSFGDEDLRLARHALTLASGCPYRLVAYHAQQCAEKHLKAYLVFRRVDFPYTHNLSRLLELCAESGGWTEPLQDAEELTPFATAVRYPGLEESVTREDALRSIEIAARVRDTVRDVLSGEGVPVPAGSSAEIDPPADSKRG